MVDPKVAALEARVAALERQLSAVLTQTMITNPAKVNRVPNGYITVMIGGDTVVIPYFATV